MEAYLLASIGFATLGSLFVNPKNKENFYNNSGHTSNQKYANPNPNVPRGEQNVDLDRSGNQLLSYQLYQQAVNAATPTQVQLNSIGGQPMDETPKNGVNPAGDPTSDNVYQAVNMENQRAQEISACAQNAPTFVATSLLPKPTIPGKETWDVNAPENILANQNFLSATQQVGVDTVLSSLRNASYDIRNTIPNPINVVSPWNMTTITPELERRPLDTFIPANGIYGAGPSGCNTNPTYVDK